MRELKTAGEVIAELGGIQAVADLFGKNYTTAHVWRTLGKFPPATFLVLGRALAQRGLTADLSLWRWAAAADGPPWERAQQARPTG